MDGRARGRAGSLAGLATVLASLSLLLDGCTTRPEFQVGVVPSRGHVPYGARITCTSLRGTYTYRLPDGDILTTTQSELAVTVDRLDWRAEVTWSDGEQTRTATAAAAGTNATPLILAPRINGDPLRWSLRPAERTLIDFTHYPDSLSGPESGVVYEGDWRVTEVAVESPLKRLCDDPIGDSIFVTPSGGGAYRAVYRGLLYENACIVYPLYTGEVTGDGRPYAPTAEEGYVYDSTVVRDLFYQVAFPEHEVAIRVAVEDEWGRVTAASFSIPVQAAVYRGGSGGGIDSGDVLLFVAARGNAFYHRTTCDEACLIPAEDRLLFRSQRNAEAAGYAPDPVCFGLR